jgi:hypothetical protein
MLHVALHVPAFGPSAVFHPAGIAELSSLGQAGAAAAHPGTGLGRRLRQAARRVCRGPVDREVAGVALVGLRLWVTLRRFLLDGFGLGLALDPAAWRREFLSMLPVDPYIGQAVKVPAVEVPSRTPALATVVERRAVIAVLMYLKGPL